MNMKTIITFTAIVFFGTMAVAQNPSTDTKVETITKPIVLTKEAKQVIEQDYRTARLYMYKNSRIKKELAFKTKRNRSKLA